MSLSIHYAEELKIETFYMSHLRPGWTTEQNWITVTANDQKTLMETEAIFCLSLHPMKKSLLLHVFTRREQNQIHYFSFSLIKLEEQRLIYKASPLPAIPTTPLSLPMDAQLQKPTEYRDTRERHHTQSCRFRGLMKNFKSSMNKIGVKNSYVQCILVLKNSSLKH